MGYIVHYSPHMDKKYPGIKNYDRKRKVKALMLIFVLVLGFLGVRYRSAVIDMIFPADGQQSWEVVSALVDDIRSGKTINEAAKAFCISVLNNAQIEFNDPA